MFAFKREQHMGLRTAIQSSAEPPSHAWWLANGESRRWTTAANIKLLLPPRQSRGTSYVRLEQAEEAAGLVVQKDAKVARAAVTYPPQSPSFRSTDISSVVSERI